MEDFVDRALIIIFFCSILWIGYNKLQEVLDSARRAYTSMDDQLPPSRKLQA